MSPATPRTPLPDPTYLPATELALRLRRREISSLALLDHYIARIERHDGAINAVVVRDFDRARERARAADAALAAGTSWGPLHGLPITVKESLRPARAADHARPGGAAPQHRHPPGRGGAAPAGRRRHRAAARPTCRSALADWQSFNPIYGTTNNPWDTGRTPGGSSGGSAAALAAGFTRAGTRQRHRRRRSATRRTTAASGATSRPGAWCRWRASSAPQRRVRRRDRHRAWPARWRAARTT